jgi:hypothetical protein
MFIPLTSDYTDEVSWSPIVQELWLRVGVACDTVKTSPGMFERVRQSTVRRAGACEEVEGSNFEHLL